MGQEKGACTYSLSETEVLTHQVDASKAGLGLSKIRKIIIIRLNAIILCRLKLCNLNLN